MIGRALLTCDFDERWNGPPPRCESKLQPERSQYALSCSFSCCPLLSPLSCSCRVRHVARQLLQHHHQCTEWHLLRLQGRDQLPAWLPHGGTPLAHLPGDRSVEQCSATLHQAGAIDIGNASITTSGTALDSSSTSSTSTTQDHPLYESHSTSLSPTEHHERHQQHSCHISATTSTSTSSQPQYAASGDQRRR